LPPHLLEGIQLHYLRTIDQALAILFGTEAAAVETPTVARDKDKKEEKQPAAAQPPRVSLH
jgi:hypothetical protein